MSSSVTALGPFPGLISLSLSSAHGVKGAPTCPGPEMPSRPASQIPVRSRRGAGPDGDGDDSNADLGNPMPFQVCARAGPDDEIRAVNETKTMKSVDMSNPLPPVTAPRSELELLVPIPVSGRWEGRRI